MPKILVFQHLPHEGLGSLAPLLQEMGFEFEILHTPQQDLTKIHFSNSLSIDGLIVMGGTMSANDENKHSFIREELRLVEAGLKQRVPVLGICLGSQILAKVLGAKVYPGKKKEIGWYPLILQSHTESDPLLKTFPASPMMFQWHGETFDLPQEGKLLASSELYPHQAFRYNNCYGLQFHPEMTLPMIRQWVEKGEKEIKEAQIPHSTAEILQESHQFIEGLHSMARGVANGFGEIVKKGKIK